MRKFNGKSILPPKIQLTIESDASTKGWEHIATGQGSRWPVEVEGVQGSHKYSGTKSSVSIALRTFVTSSSKESQVLLLDNRTAISYLNHKN